MAKTEETPAPIEALSLQDLDVSFSVATGYYLTEPEKRAIVDSGQRFYITGIVLDVDNQFGPRYVLTIVPEGDPDAFGRGYSMAVTPATAPRTVQLAKLASAMEAAQGCLVGPVEFYHPINERTGKAGRVVLFR